MTTRSFHLGDILSVTTHRLVSPRRMEGVYDILGWMTGEHPYDGQIPRLIGECAGTLLAQHPDLTAVTVPEFGSEREAYRWLAGQVALYGETREIEPLAAVDDHTRVDPVAEMRMVNPNAVVIVGEPPGRAS
jgi:hypothetical protein